MGKRTKLNPDQEMLINKLIMEGIKPSDIRDYFAKKVVKISIATVNNYKAELKKKLTESGVPLEVPVTYGNRNKESKSIAKASIEAITGAYPKGKILQVQKVHIDIKKCHFFINDVPISFAGTPKAMMFDEKNLHVQYKTHTIRISLKN